MLRNARHERFCQAFASGNTLEKAHEIAGYNPDRRNAWILRQRDDISRRIDVILKQRDVASADEITKASEIAAVTRADVLVMLLEDHKAAKILKQMGPAIRAVELLGKELGMFIDRHESRFVDEFESMEERQLRQLVADRARAVAVRNDEADEPGTRH